MADGFGDVWCPCASEDAMFVPKLAAGLIPRYLQDETYLLEAVAGWIPCYVDDANYSPEEVAGWITCNVADAMYLRAGWRLGSLHVLRKKKLRSLLAFHTKGVCQTG